MKIELPLYERDPRRRDVLETLAWILTEREKELLLSLVPAVGPSTLLEESGGEWYILKRADESVLRGSPVPSRGAVERLRKRGLIHLISLLGGGATRYEVSVLGTHLALYLRRPPQENSRPRRV
jgi:hypothetical protein